MELDDAEGSLRSLNLKGPQTPTDEAFIRTAIIIVDKSVVLDSIQHVTNTSNLYSSVKA